MGWHNPPVSWRELEQRLSWNVTQLPPGPERDRLLMQNHDRANRFVLAEAETTVKDGRFEVKLPAAEHVDVERVDARRIECGPQPKPAPARDAAGQHFAPSLVADVAELDAIVRVRHFDQRGVRREMLECS